MSVILFWEFHDKLFENYTWLNDAKIQENAIEIGLDTEKFSNDLKNPAIQQLISVDIKNGK